LKKFSFSRSNKRWTGDFYIENGYHFSKEEELGATFKRQNMQHDALKLSTLTEKNKRSFSKCFLFGVYVLTGVNFFDSKNLSFATTKKS